MRKAVRTALATVFIAIVFSLVAIYAYQRGHNDAYENICENIIGGMWHKGQCIDPRAIILREPGAIS